MGELKDIVGAASEFLWNTPRVMPFMVTALLFTGLFLTVRFGLVQVRRFGHGVRAVLGRYSRPGDPGDVSHFQALSSALSATVGIGNIAGVATAVHYGGPGAVFWLWLTGFIGMATKFAECTLAQKFRAVHVDGSVSGGPMYYIEKGLGPRWRWLAMTFAACAVVSSFGSGNAIQAFTMADSLRSDFGIPPWVSGLVSAMFVGLVIIGGIRRIGQVTSFLVPFMGAFYVLAALLVIGLHIGDLSSAVSAIVAGAFSPPGMVGGFAGSTFVFTLTWGVKRGLFSNEAGQGSAPIAHAAARTEEPVREGAVALLEPFIDTVVICFMTGLVVVLTGTWNQKHPEEVPFTAQSAISVVREGTVVQPTGKVPEGDLFTGETLVREGRPAGVALVRNHAVMEDVRLTRNGRPFEGTLAVRAGSLVGLRDRDGTVLSGASVRVRGRTLLNGSPLAAKSFEVGLSALFPWGNYLVTIAVFLFAISTAISWSYYGDRAIQYLVGPRAVMPYRIIYLVMHFLGAIFSLEVVWGFGDVALGLMALPNLFGVLRLSGLVSREARDYFARMAVVDGKAARSSGRGGRDG